MRNLKEGGTEEKKSSLSPLGRAQQGAQRHRGQRKFPRSRWLDASSKVLKRKGKEEPYRRGRQEVDDRLAPESRISEDDPQVKGFDIELVDKSPNKGRGKGEKKRGSIKKIPDADRIRGGREKKTQTPNAHAFLRLGLGRQVP